MIRVDQLTKSFGDRRILDEVTFDLEPGSVTAIVGASGAGKSTLLRCLNFLERPDRGTVTIDDLEVDAVQASRADVLELRRRTAMVFQQFNLFGRRTALENVSEGLRVVRGQDAASADREARAQLERVGLGEYLDHYPRQLSGGQQQRVGIARALAMEPAALLLDEPTSALDPELVGEVLATIRRVAAEGQTMVLVSHEMHFVRQVAGRVLFLERGRILADLPPSEFFSPHAPERVRAFLREYHLAHGTSDYQI